MQDNEQASLFNGLTIAEEEILSGGFLKPIGRFFKKHGSKVAMGAGVLAMLIFGKKAHVCKTDEFGNSTCHPM